MWSGLRCPECCGDPFPGCRHCGGSLREFKEEIETMANGKMIGGEGEQGGDLDKIVPPLLMLDESAIKRGGERGGAYLDSLGRYDLSQLTPEEYTYFATCVVTGALEQMTAYLLSRLEQKIPF